MSEVRSAGPGGDDLRAQEKPESLMIFATSANRSGCLGAIINRLCFPLGVFLIALNASITTLSSGEWVLAATISGPPALVSKRWRRSRATFESSAGRDTLSNFKLPSVRMRSSESPSLAIRVVSSSDCIKAIVRSSHTLCINRRIL